MVDLAEVQKGEGSLSLKIEEGMVKLAVLYDGKQADAMLEVKVSVDEYLEMLKKAIPGTLDDTVISLIQVAMKNA